MIIVTIRSMKAGGPEHEAEGHRVVIQPTQCWVYNDVNRSTFWLPYNDQRYSITVIEKP